MTSPEEFREFGKAMIDYVADYLENIRDRPVLPSVKPGYLQQLVPEEAPEEPETWQVIFLFCKELCLEGLEKFNILPENDRKYSYYHFSRM